MKGWIQIIMVTVFGFTSCAGSGSGTNGQLAAEINLIESVQPVYGKIVAQGDTLDIKVFLAKSIEPDSVFLKISGTKITLTTPYTYSFVLTENHPVGRTFYTVTAWHQGQEQSRTGEFTVLAREEPAMYSHRVKSVFPHDTKAYTQGLLFHDGHLYESTGLEGQSSLRKVELSTGKIVRKVDLPRNYFGEGLELLNGKLYQLTWQNNLCLVYDLETFQKINEFPYSGQGWGLTTDGTYLYMSDGSEKIRKIDPETFRTLETIEVYTDKRKVLYINEMEWIGGEIWANVYTTDTIIRIDPKTGAVLGVIDLSNLLSTSDISRETDVLNGIAYDKETNRIFVTGKNWNKLFEVEIQDLNY